jgi:hypothetical protein
VRERWKGSRGSGWICGELATVLARGGEIEAVANAAGEADHEAGGDRDEGCGWGGLNAGAETRPGRIRLGTQPGWGWRVLWWRPAVGLRAAGQPSECFGPCAARRPEFLWCVREGVLAPRWDAGKWNRVIPGPSRCCVPGLSSLGPLGRWDWVGGWYGGQGRDGLVTVAAAGEEASGGTDVARDATRLGLAGVVVETRGWPAGRRPTLGVLWALCGEEVRVPGVC